MSLGLDFCLPVLRFPKRKLNVSLELFLSRIKSVPIFSPKIFNDVVCKSKEMLSHLPRMIIIIVITRQVLGRPVCDRGAIPRTLVQSNVVRSRLIILINEEINEANWMVSNSDKLDRRTKQHTQFGVSASNGSRDMARTKSWRKKRKK